MPVPPPVMTATRPSRSKIPRSIRRSSARAARAVVHPVLRERADERVLVEAVADGAVALREARHLVDDRELPESLDVGHLEHPALHDERSLVHAVPPVG